MACRNGSTCGRTEQMSMVHHPNIDYYRAGLARHLFPLIQLYGKSINRMRDTHPRIPSTIVSFCLPAYVNPCASERMRKCGRVHLCICAVYGVCARACVRGCARACMCVHHAWVSMRARVNKRRGMQLGNASHVWLPFLPRSPTDPNQGYVIVDRDSWSPRDYCGKLPPPIPTPFPA